MSITVQDCLNLPAFHSSRLIAGKGGLERVVSSVSVLEIPEEPYSPIKVFNPNELLVTSFYAIKDNPSKQSDCLRLLIERGCVALVLFYVNDIIEHVSDELIQTADLLNVPLIVIDDDDEYSVRYSDIIKDVMSAVFQDQSLTNDFSDSIKRRLLQIPDDKRSMETLLNVISEFYKCNITLYSKSGLYFTSIHRPSYGQFDPEFFLNTFNDNLTDYSYSNVFLQDKSFYLYKKDFSHAGNTWLTLFVSCNENNLNEHLLNEISICTNYFSTLWGYSLDMHNYNTGISLIFKASRMIGEKFLAQNAVAFSSISTIIIIDSAINVLPKILKQVETTLKEYDKFLIADIIDNRLVILSSLTISSKIDNIIFSEIKNHIMANPETYLFLEVSKDISSMRKIYSDYCANSSAMNKIFIHSKFRNMHDVTFSQEIKNLAIKKGRQNRYIQSIIDELDEDSDNLLETLSVYLIDCDSQLSLTASTLFLHRNTVAYRLNRIKQIFNTDFTKMPAFYEYYLAVALWRLTKK